MRTVNFSDARSNLKQLLDEVVADHTVTLIKRRDAGDAVVMSLDDYSAIEETMYLLSTPANASWLIESLAEAHAAFPSVRVLGPEDFGGAAPVPQAPTATGKTTRAGSEKSIRNKSTSGNNSLTASALANKVDKAVKPKSRAVAVQYLSPSDSRSRLMLEEVKLPSPRVTQKTKARG
ncbi:type II toxin-antitoxin system prevent-host-death family antitoxin [Rhodanobacter glycinis]|uniref:Antitoxin n=1 Tax=Rhodanobacter glycinis TaxID=582702 RepID=A0A502CF65_9GAMM|nr:type II toxin-antitoxin system prevent-host-death family antitoxin [Rhodanobacter glycinis]TPG11332.1 type II toxin-antitoxin system prevent-host-death family antitoxin [Rhodanobacter glycinis]TPG48823.1 type II toxin-antitoxin system prevent-host-death family antitoxin [Rhodanobacter glycinis]